MSDQVVLPPYLYDLTGAAASVDWHDFLREQTELRDKYHDVQFFGAVNCNYIVFSSGLLVRNYGFHGQALMDEIREKGVTAVEGELRESRRQTENAVAQLFARERQTARDLCDWLLSCPQAAARGEGVESAVPVRVHFGPKDYRRQVQPSWFGAMYCEKHVCQATERSVTEGLMKAGELVRSYRFYLLGDMFRHSQRRDKWVVTYALPAKRRQPLERCYTPSDEWYTAFYWQDHKPYTRTAPFGRAFGLVLYQQMNFGYYKDWKIDTGECKPYVRLPMTVEYL